MSVRRKNIEEQAMRLREYVSEAVCAATGESLLMTQTLDQMVRSAAKAGVTLHISTENQLHSIEMLSNQLRLSEISLVAERDQLKAENEALRKDAGRYQWLRRQIENCAWMAGASTIVDKWGNVDEERVSDAEDLDGTIDAAMSQSNLTINLG